ncbi:ATP-binding protein [Actinotalea sp. AC32]|nr:ATP-binding protein [Actinotalea sp. AC32]
MTAVDPGARVGLAPRAWPRPDDEPQRLAAVHALGLLDSAPEERFDRIARLAARSLRVPVALVSLVDAERQWYKAAAGTACTEVPRDESVCGYVLVEDPDGVFVVEDLTADPRFAHLPAVTGDRPYRAYASHVLRAHGRAVGTICVLDHVPRRFDDDDLATLADLARWAEVELRADEDRWFTGELDVLKRRTEMVLAGVAEGVVGVDRAGRVTFINAAGRALLGRHDDGWLGVDLHAVTHARALDGSVLPVETCPVTEVLATGVSRRMLHDTFWRHDGSPMPVDWSVGAVVDGDVVVGAVVVFGDASQRLEVERMKDEFTTVVSHELRTPLTSLKGALELLGHGLGGQLEPEAVRLVEMGRRNANRLARLVDDILDVERLSRGGIPMTRRPLDIHDLMQSAVATVQGMAAAKDIRIETVPAEGVVWGDEHRLLQVLTNLLGNALRFSPEGSCITLHGERDVSAVRIGVTDQGVGIPEDSLDRVFDRFWQVDASSRRASGGTGLGLAIAKNIVEAHGGIIRVESTVGEGSTFLVCLPLRSRDRPVAVDRRRSAPDPEETS